MAVIKLRIPLSQYAYMETDFEGTPEEAIQESLRLETYYQKEKERLESGVGLSQNDWSRFKRDFLINGTYTMEDFDKLSKAQRWWLHENEKTLQQIKNK